MDLVMQTCQCEVKNVLAALYEPSRREVLQKAFDTYGRDAAWHMWFEEEYIFPHLNPEHQARLLAEHTTVKQLMQAGNLTAASQALMAHAAGETQIFNSMRSRP